MNFNFNDDYKRPFAVRVLIEIAIWAVQIIAVILLAYFIINFALEKTTMVGVSMESTLKDGDAILINKFSYRFSKPKRFDVIVFKQSGKEHNFYNIKRVIGLPGETVQMKKDGIYINSKLIKDIVKTEPIVNNGLAGEEIKLEENEYFVLGDNRNNSEDSRFASIGNIRKDEIIGKAFVRLSPFNFISKLNLIDEDKLKSTTQE